MKKEEEKKKTSKKRGASVKVVADDKKIKEDIHVNAYFEKNDTRRKKKSKKQTAKIKSETKKPASFSTASQPKVAVEVKKEKKPDEKKPVDQKVTEKVAEKVAEKPTEEKVAERAEKPAEEKVAERAEKPAEEKVEKVAEKPAEEEVTEKPAEEKVVEKPVEEKAVEEKAVEKPVEKRVAEENPEEFETLKLNTEISQLESKIILRDVAREKIEFAPEPKEIEKAQDEVSQKPEVIVPIRTTTPKEKSATLARPTAKEIKDREIKKALKTATKLPETQKKRSRKSAFATNFGWPRIVLAVTCAATAVFAIVYFINLTSTDMSLKVAAMQSGIEASYPSYVPRGYNLSDVTSSSGKVTMNFKTDEGTFSISEENTTWDSDALLSNYIKPTYGDNYTVVREQGLTLFMGDAWEAWVNGGILYKLTVKTGSLTKKQMKTIATSL